jgi:hypothetical protein
VQPDPDIPPQKIDSETGSAPPPLLPSPAPPLLEAHRKPAAARKYLAVVLSLCLGLFVIDGLVSVVDDTLVFLFGIHFLWLIRGLVFLVTLILIIVTYLLIGVTPMVPKRIFLPLTLFIPCAELLPVLFSIYHFNRLPQFAFALSLCEAILGVGLLYCVLGGFKLRWPLVSESQLEGRGFSWWNLCGFLLGNIFLLIPAVAGYLFVCLALSINHFSEGFVSLSPKGLTVQMRKYVRADGKTIRLFPMVHIADADFYGKVSESFPTNSIILMEGVTDEKKLLTNGISYHRIAKKLGLGEQQKAFRPERGDMVRADVDVQDFSTNTIALLNLVMYIHAQGLNVGTLMKVLQYPQPPGFEDQLFDDILKKRNQNLLKEINAHLSDTENIVVPWGAMHMPGVSAGIEKTGFHQDGSQDYLAIGFFGNSK